MAESRVWPPFFSRAWFRGGRKPIGASFRSRFGGPRPDQATRSPWRSRSSAPSGSPSRGPRPRPSPRKCSSPSPATPCTSASPRSSRGRPPPCSSPRTSTGRTPSGRPRAGGDRRGTPEGYVARRSARAPSHAGEHRLSSSSRRVTVFSLSRRSGFPARARSDRRADEISNASRALPSPSL